MTGAEPPSARAMACARISRREKDRVSPMDSNAILLPRASTGVEGLDFVLGGGFARNRLHLLEGNPGTGKTTIALQFLMAGAAAGEVGVYVSLAETEHDRRAGARTHGWRLNDTVEIFELVSPESVLD